MIEYAPANEPVFERENEYYFYSPATEVDGFTRKLSAAAIQRGVSFYHLNSDTPETCILDSYLWCCAKGPVADLDANGTVTLEDFATFANCFNTSWEWNSTLDTLVVSGNQACNDDEVLRCDLTFDGFVNLNDFATFSLQFYLGDGVGESCGVGEAMGGPVGSPAPSGFLEFAAGPLWNYRAADPAWTSAVRDVIAVLHAGGPNVERRLRPALHNLPWDSLDDLGG